MLKNLQNGSDIRGIAIQTEDKNINLTSENCYLIAQGFYIWLKNKIGKSNLTIAIGADPRLSGDKIKNILIDNFIQNDVRVIDCGLATTPAMFMANVFEDYSCDGSIMITASHLPYYYNGMKFFTKNGGCESTDIAQILKYAEEFKLSGNIQINDSSITSGLLSNKNIIEDYSKFLVDKIRTGIDSKINFEKPLTGFHIVVDAGNGSGGFFASHVLDQLGANTSGSQFLNPDGNFSNHIPNPEDKVAMYSIKQAVIKNNADIGIIFDTDVDRAAIVGGNGEEINRNSLIALISAIVLEDYPGSTIVTDSVTSIGLTKFINKRGGVHHRFKRGYRNVINESMRLNNMGINSQLAIETSGHAAMKENYFLDDGAYLISKILIKMAKLKQENRNIEDLISDLEHPNFVYNSRFSIMHNDFKLYGQKIIDELPEFIKNVNGWTIEKENYEGIRVICSDDSGSGWFLLRLSLHEPVMAFDAESDANSNEGIKFIIETLSNFFAEFEYLNTDNL